jgi:hypothetical protein
MMRWANIAHQNDAFASHFPQRENLPSALACEILALIEPRWSIRLILRLKAKTDLFRCDPRDG